MLPAALLVYRIQDDEVVPAFLGDRDQPWLRCLLEERERFVGAPRRELARRLREGLPVASPARRRQLAAHVLEALAAAPPVGRRSRVLRTALCTARASSPAARDDVVAEVARGLGTTAAAVEEALFADLPGERPVAPLARSVSPLELADRCNLALARGLLARADHVELVLFGNALPVVRAAKLRGLIVNVRQTAEGACVLDVSGPLALFHRTRMYGRALGALLPQLAWCTSFRLEARCTVAEGTFAFRLASGAPIFPAAEPRRYDSGVEARFAASIRRHAPDWDVVRDPRPLRAVRPRQLVAQGADLDLVRDEPVAAPGRRAGDVAPGVVSPDPRELREERRPVGDRRALLGGERRELGAARAGAPIGVALLGAQADDDPLDAQVVAGHRERWREIRRREGEAADEEASFEAWRPKS